MKTYRFFIKEYWFGGVNERIIEVQARTEKSALKKCIEIQGNRAWEILSLDFKKQIHLLA